VEIAEARLRYHVRSTGRVDEGAARALVLALPRGGKVMQTWIDDDRCAPSALRP
jgi:hypothetical protein